MDIIGFTCWGIAGRGCNKLHKTRSEVLQCCFDHIDEVAKEGKRSDRQIYRVGADGYLYSPHGRMRPLVIDMGDGCVASVPYLGLDGPHAKFGQDPANG